MRMRFDKVKIEIKIDENCSETKIVIVTNKMSDEVSELVQTLSDESPQTIIGYTDGYAKILEHPDIVRIYATNGKVYAESGDKEYLLRLRLYEIEEKLNNRTFIRISNSEIVNLKKVKKFDLNLVGTICVSLSNGKKTYASRRYVSKIKQALGL